MSTGSDASSGRLSRLLKGEKDLQKRIAQEKRRLRKKSLVRERIRERVLGRVVDKLAEEDRLEASFVGQIKSELLLGVIILNRNETEALEGFWLESKDLVPEKSDPVGED